MSFTGLQIGWHISFLHIVKVYLVLKLHGPTKSITAIERFPLIWLHW